MKRRMKFLWDCFCMISTCVMIVLAVFTTIINPIERMETVVLWQAIMVSFLCAASTFIFPWDRIMKKWEVPLRTGVHYLFINLIVLGFGNWFDWYQISDWRHLFSMLISIAVIYAVVSGLSWRRSKQDAKKLNESLAQYRGEKQ